MGVGVVGGCDLRWGREVGEPVAFYPLEVISWFFSNVSFWARFFYFFKEIDLLEGLGALLVDGGGG